jgi:hypothetical protein
VLSEGFFGSSCSAGLSLWYGAIESKVSIGSCQQMQTTAFRRNGGNETCMSPSSDLASHFLSPSTFSFLLFCYPLDMTSVEQKEAF